jgi:hypothetical protein
MQSVTRRIEAHPVDLPVIDIAVSTTKATRTEVAQLRGRIRLARAGARSSVSGIDATSTGRGGAGLQRDALRRRIGSK